MNWRSTWMNLLLRLVSILVPTVSVVAQDAAASDLEVVALRVEARVEPLGVDLTVPRLSWQLRGRGLRQTAFRILVSTTRDALAADRGDLWDSGKVESDATSGVEYGGIALVAHQDCFWKVRAWDESDRPTAFSDPAHWSVGVLDPAEWNAAAWIGFDADRDLGSADVELGDASWIADAADEPLDAAAGLRWFVGRCELPDDAERAELVVLGDDKTTCVLNGTALFESRVGWRDGTPLDVTGLARGGVNELRIQVENDSRGPSGLVARLRVVTAAGATIDFVTDGTWRSVAPTPDWQTSAIDDALTTPVRVLGVYGMAPWGRATSRALRLAPVPLLRRRFTLDAPVRRAVLYGTALGVVDFELNGARVADERFTPGWTDYTVRVPYRAWDVTERLREGANVLGAQLADGWFSGYIGWGRVRDHYGTRPRMRAMLRIETVDGAVRTIVTDEDWLARSGPVREADFLMGERFDAREAVGGWSAPGGDDGAWSPVDVGAEVAPKVEWHRGPPVVAIGEFAPRAITEPVTGVHVVDLGQNFAGVVRLRVRGERGREITLRFAERLEPDGTIYVTNLRGARAVDTYVCSGEGVEVWEPRFTFHGFQFVEITGLKRGPSPQTVTGIALSSDTPRVGAFECSDPMLNQLASNVYWTQRANFIDVPTDCPQRDERLGWAGDAQVYVRTAALNCDVQAFFSKWLVDLTDAQREDGQFPMVAPLKIAGADGGPAWSDAGTIVPWAIFEVYGDRRLLERQFPSMLRFVGFCEGRSRDGVLPPQEFHCFGDWLSIDAPTPKELIYTAYYAHSVDLTRRAAEVLGRDEDAARLAALHARIKAAFVDEFFDAEGRVVADTQCGYVLALAYDLLDGPLRDAAAAHLVANLVARDDHLSTGFIGTKDLMLVLSKIGREDIAYRLLKNDTFPSWGFSIRHGATSIWERWDGWTPEKGFQDPGMNSFAHYSFGAVQQWIVENVGGIRMTGAGYGAVRIAPRPGGGLTSAKTGYDSVRGPIATAWRIEGKTFALDVDVPPNLAAVVTVPTSEPRSVRESGETIDVRGLRVIGSDERGVTIGVPAGSWRFTALR